MSMFPTLVSMKIAQSVNIQKLTLHDVDLKAAIGDFQRVAATGSFEEAMIMLDAHIYHGKISEEQETALRKIYDFTEVEVNGQVIDSIGKVMKDSDIEANKLAAAKLLHEIRNGDDGDTVKGAVKKVIFELEK